MCSYNLFDIRDDLGVVIILSCVYIIPKEILTDLFTIEKMLPLILRNENNDLIFLGDLV